VLQMSEKFREDGILMFELPGMLLPGMLLLLLPLLPLPLLVVEFSSVILKV